MSGRVAGMLGSVAVLAQMREHHVDQVGVRDFLKKRSSCPVTEMAVRGGDSLLELPGVSALLEKLGIVVRLQNQHMATRNRMAHEGCHTTEIGCLGET